MKKKCEECTTMGIKLVSMFQWINLSLTTVLVRKFLSHVQRTRKYLQTHLLCVVYLLMVGHPSAMIQHKVESTLPHAANMSLIHGLCKDGCSGAIYQCSCDSCSHSSKANEFCKVRNNNQGNLRRSKKKAFRCRRSANAGHEREHFASQFSVQHEILNAGKKR